MRDWVLLIALSACAHDVQKVAPASSAQPTVAPVPEVRQDGTVMVVMPPGQSADRHFAAIAVVQQSLQKKDAGIFECYRQALQHDPYLRGRITYQLRVEHTGKVRTVQASDRTVDGGELDQCVIGVLRRVKFKKSTGSADVYYALAFSPQPVGGEQPGERRLQP